MMSVLKVMFSNNSKVPDSQVFIGFVGGSSLKVTNFKDNSAISTIDNGVGPYPFAGNWYTLIDLSAGVGITSFSGRIYVAYGTPWVVQLKGYEPAQALPDLNLFLRYDKMEITFTGGEYDVANLTSIDYWSIPMSLSTFFNGNPVQTIQGLIGDTTAQQVFDQLNALTTPPVSGLTGPGGVNGTPIPALVPGEYEQYDDKSPVPGTTFARIIGPSSYPPINPPPGARPVMPYDLFSDYLDYLYETFGPQTQAGAVVPNLGKGVIALIAGNFAGVGHKNDEGEIVVPPDGPEAKQTYSLQATIDADKDITLSGSASSVGAFTMLFKYADLTNPSGIYGGNAPFYFNGSSNPTAPPNNIYGWVCGDLFSGINIGAVGSSTKLNGSTVMVGSTESSEWFKIPTNDFFSVLQPNRKNYNQWAATLSKLSQAYNFAYTDRFAHVFVSLKPTIADTLKVDLLDATVNMKGGK